MASSHPSKKMSFGRRKNNKQLIIKRYSERVQRGLEESSLRQLEEKGCLLFVCQKRKRKMVASLNTA